MVSVTLSLTTKAQTVENLTKIHSKSSTYLSPYKVVSLADHVYTFMHFDNKDTLFIDGESQTEFLSPGAGESNHIEFVISKFDLNHKLVNLGSISGTRILCKNIQVHQDKIYVFVNFSVNPSLKYNGAEIWKATQNPNDWEDSWNVMVVLDEDLNLLDVKGIDHYNSGFDGIAFGDGRMYLSGYFTNISDTKETVEVDGYKLSSLTSERNLGTSFMLTYDTQLGKIIHSELFNVYYYGYYTGTQSLLVGLDGCAYQLIMSSGGVFTYQDLDFELAGLWSANVLIKYTLNGKVDKIVNLCKNNVTFISEMHMTTTGDLLLYGECWNGLGYNGVDLVKTHLPYAAVLFSLDGKDLSLKWYDYMASEQKIWVGGIATDKEDNIYIMNSNGIGLLAEDKEGKTLISGNHIYKYNMDGKRLSDFRSQYGKPFFLSTKGVDTLIIMKGVGSIQGSFDSLLNITNNYGNTKEFALFQLILNKTSGFIEIEKNEKDRIYPNPVHKDGLLTISGDHSSVDKAFVISDRMGRTVASGKLDDTAQICLSSYNLNSGIYFIRIGKDDSIPMKMLILE